ncbi:MAG: RHS repeat-associated core domain-containing protein [Polyangiaceae bacterium]|nr:RHS repeat-associated core domain-containing protein [Polyangiaceae bacterium]
MGRLVTARRWDAASLDVEDTAAPAGPAAVELHYGYDANDQRVSKRAVDPAGEQSFTLYVFDSLELRRTAYLPLEEDYALNPSTEVIYLLAGSARLARLAYEAPGSVPSSGGETVHVFLELGDHLGSTNTVLDLATSELVEKSTHYAYGGIESDYRPTRWNSFREDYKFTGKEEDIEVGLVYFGKRFYAPALQRWASPDPLTVHGLGADPNLYAYVSGQVLKSVDPLGLEKTRGGEKEPAKTTREEAGKRLFKAILNVAMPVIPMGDAIREQTKASIEAARKGDVPAAIYEASKGAEDAFGVGTGNLESTGRLLINEAKATKLQFTLSQSEDLWGDVATIGEQRLYGGAAVVSTAAGARMPIKVTSGARASGRSKGGGGAKGGVNPPSGTADAAPVAPTEATPTGGPRGTAGLTGGQGEVPAPRSVGAAESSFSIASRGGRHAGFLKRARSMSRVELERTARSLQKGIEKHEGFLDNPAQHVPNWNKLRPEHQQSLIGHWQKEIATFAEQQSIVLQLLR